MNTFSISLSSQVGSFNDSHFLKLDITYEPTVTAACDADRSDPDLGDCVCEFPPDLRSRYMLNEDGGRGLTLVYVGDVHKASTSGPLGCGLINTGKRSLLIIVINVVSDAIVILMLWFYWKIFL